MSRNGAKFRRRIRVWRGIWLGVEEVAVAALALEFELVHADGTQEGEVWCIDMFSAVYCTAIAA